jgi:Copper binding proteins, plastocyanin/azurin family
MRRSHGVLLIGLAAIAVTATAIAGVTQTRLVGTTGPGFSITLRDAQGAGVTNLPTGEYDIEVDDRSAEHNFHLIGPGVDEEVTDVPFVGKKTVTVTLQTGTYTYQCDPHAASGMKGTFTVT